MDNILFTYVIICVMVLRDIFLLGLMFSAYHLRRKYMQKDLRIKK